MRKLFASALVVALVATSAAAFAPASPRRRTSSTPPLRRAASRPWPRRSQAAGLIETLKGAGPFTVFAPTDEAFAKLPAGTLDALLKDKAKLTAILTYHVVAGKVMAADVVKLKEAKTVQGQSIKIDTSNGVKVDGANVIKTDIVASNGVIHVIDSVILPK